MKSLDEAIEKYEGDASLLESFGQQTHGSLQVHCYKYAAEYRQITGWLKELRGYRNGEKEGNFALCGKDNAG